jgi:multisubunit Na+/H+ antiporter MnhC subunit
MRKVLEIGGFVAAAVLIAFGVTAIVLGVNGRQTVQDNLKYQYITGTPDMTPAAIKAEAQKAGIYDAVKIWPTKSVAGQTIDTGSEARAFAQYMNIHALEASGGLTYAQMPRYATADGKGTNDVTKALMVGGQPQDNAARNVWVTETALSGALNMAYMAEQTALFGIIVGVALLLSGIGFGVLALGGTLKNAEPALKLFGSRTPKTAVPTA